MIIYLLFLPLVAVSLGKDDFIDQARLYIYKRNLVGAVLWEKGGTMQWNSLINAPDAEEPPIELPYVDNLTISDIPSWIPDDYNTVVEILDLYKRSKFLPGEEGTELDDLMDGMLNTYISAKVCPYHENENETCVPDMQMEEIRNSTEDRDEKVLLYYWKAWREETGKKIRKDYQRFIPLKNQESRLNDYQDAGHEWRDEYKTECFRQEVEQLWKEIRPLYEHLHAYIRRKLMQKYEGILKPDGPIPAHLLTYTMDEMWLNINEFTRPYPEKPTLDITEALRQKGMTPRDMASIADDFYVSLGMSPMNEIFWNESVLEKPTDREMDCYPVSLDIGKKGAHRTRFCSLVRLEDLFIIFHEMGHIHYFLQSETQPLLKYRSPNGGLHEAIGGSVALSALTPEYLNEIGLLEDFIDDKEQDINFLYMVALMRIGSLSHFYMVDKWRWDVFDGTIAETELNTNWWKYRLELQGQCPYVQRTENDFDAGAVYLVARHVPVISYFVAGILEFQFHKALCDAKGHVGPLYKCSIHNSTEAGDRLTSMLKLGSSVSWRSAIHNITGGKSNGLDTKPLLEYFQPLLEWLKDQNKNHPVGWKSKDPTVCP